MYNMLCEMCNHSKVIENKLYCRFYGDECQNHNSKMECVKCIENTVDNFTKDFKVRQKMENMIMSGKLKCS